MLFMCNNNSKKTLKKKKTPICFHDVSKCGVLQRWRPFLPHDMTKRPNRGPIFNSWMNKDVAQFNRRWQHQQNPNHTDTVACLRPHTVNKSINPSWPSPAEAQIGQLTV